MTCSDEAATSFGVLFCDVFESLSFVAQKLVKCKQEEMDSVSPNKYTSNEIPEFRFYGC